MQPSEAGITYLMGKPRKVALYAAHVASTEPRDLTGAPRDLHRLGLINWHTANTANEVAILHQMINGLDTDLANIAYTEMWVVSQQTGALGPMTEFPCCPSNAKWWGRTAVPRSWALQIWTDMAKYGVDTNTILEDSAKPREHDRRVLDCCLAEDEHAVFKWSTRAGVRWLSQLCGGVGTHPRKDILS